MKKSAIIVGGLLLPHNALPSQYPRQDYNEIAQKTSAVIYGDETANRFWHKTIRAFEKQVKLDASISVRAVKNVHSHNLILSTSEKLAIPVAILLRLQQYNIPHVVIAHKLSSRPKKLLFKLLPLHKNFNQIITVSKAQANYAIDYLGLLPNQVHALFSQVDHDFFQPQPVAIEDFIFAVGQEQRDYQTLIQATKNTNIRILILANSRWSSYKSNLPRAENVHYLTTHLSFAQLRDFYAKAKLVVLPLKNVDYAAGVNCALEAMAMGKALVVSASTGIQEYLAHGETVFTVEPENAMVLRDGILQLWHDANERKRLGCNARQVVEEKMNLEIYVNNVVDIMYRANHHAGQ